MAEKAASNYLSNLENFLAGQNPALIEAVKIFQELDQVEFELGILDNEDTTASKVSWWPVISVMGTAASGKAEFINQYLKSNVLHADVDSTSEKVTVYQHSVNQSDVTLPGTALDGDPRFPFFRTSKKIEEVVKGQGQRINNYLQLKTCTSARLKDKILIDMPELLQTEDKVCHFLFSHVIAMSDLVLIFLETSQSNQASLEPMLAEMTRQQDPDKFIFVVFQKGDQGTSPFAEQETTRLKKQLTDLGMKSTQFLVLDQAKAKVVSTSGGNVLSQIAGHKPTTTSPERYSDLEFIEGRMENVNIHRAYQILDSLEKSIRANEEVIVPEVKDAIRIWKERSHFTLVLIVGIGVSILVFLEVHLGIVSSLFDPILGSIVLAIALLLLTPIYLLISKTHAQYVLNSLEERRKIEGLLENPAGLFEKSLTKWRMLLPVKKPLGWDKSIQARLQVLLERAKNLFQYLNDDFSR
jgi:hypothetical protein